MALSSRGRGLATGTSAQGRVDVAARIASRPNNVSGMLMPVRARNDVKPHDNRACQDRVSQRVMLGCYSGMLLLVLFLRGRLIYTGCLWHQEKQKQQIINN